MDFDLGSRSSKLRKEQEKRRMEAKRKQLQKQKVEREVKLKQAAIEEAARLKRIEELKRKEQEEERRLEEERATGGINYSAVLDAVPTSDDGDKLRLPPSALEQLNPQDALDLGALVFEVKATESSHITHAGVLEFSAEEGTVGVPPKTATSLLHYAAPGTTGLGKLQIRFVRVGAGRAVQLQPLGDGFGDRELDFKTTLERSLKMHTTLTKGDVLLVRQNGQTVKVIVQDVKPEEKARILNVDLEVDLVPCESVEREMRRKEEEKKRVLDEQRQRHEAEKRNLEERDKLALKLPDEPEPKSAADPSFKCLVRFPNGKQATRRMRLCEPMKVLFWVSVVQGEQTRHDFHLGCNYPRRVFTEARDGEKTFAEAGFRANTQEAFFVEKSTDQETTITEAGAGAVDKVEDVTPLDVEMEEFSAVETHNENVWLKARTEFEKQIDESLLNGHKVSVHGLEPAFPVLSHLAGEDKWRPQLDELAVMGFENVALNVEILERFQGRLLRVVNYLSELNN